MTPNRIDATLAPEALATIQSQLDAIRAALPFLEDLTPDERRSLPKMGDKSQAFVTRTLELARQDDSYLPRSLDVDAFARDLDLWRSLESIRVRLTQLNELVDDTQIAVGSEAYLAALEVYAAAKRANVGGGLDDLVDRVSRRFATRRADTPPTP